jgi:hypothetical protein
MNPRAALGLLLFSLAGCLESLPGRVSQAADVAADAAPQPRKIDILWVIEQSVGPASALPRLADAMPRLLEGLEAAGPVDVHFAVTSMDLQCDLSLQKGITASLGRFNRVPAAAYPPSVRLTHPQACRTDADCDPPGEEGLWRCRAQPTDLCIVNPNGSINSTCRRTCQTDAECRDTFGRDRLICLTPGDDPSESGCADPPRTEGCPAELPLFLTAEQRDLWRCAVDLPVYADKCFHFEQGLGAGLAALDPAGPNPAQSAAFLRDDAWLLVSFFTHEGDCSIPAGARIGEDYYTTCAYDLPAAGTQLLSVEHFAAAYRALKADPSRVFIAAIGGDSLAPDEATRESEREAFLASILDPYTCHQRSSICTASHGRAGWSRRYQQLAAAFGDRGLFANYCAEDYAPAMTAIAQAFNAVAPP